MLLTKLKRSRVVVLPLPVEDRLLSLLLVAVSGLGVRDVGDYHGSLCCNDLMLGSGRCRLRSWRILDVD
jgi:hypothetical protein